MSKKKYIIDKTIPLFVKYGIYKTSTKMILNETNLTNGAFFNYFKNKNELVMEAYIQCKIEMLSYNLDQISNVLDNKEIIKSYFYSVVYWGINNPEARLFMRQVANEPFIREYNFSQDQKEYEPILSKLALAISDKNIHIWDDFSFLLNTYSLTESIIDYLTVNTTVNQESYIDFCFEQYFHSLNYNPTINSFNN